MVWVPKAMKKSEKYLFLNTLACLKVRDGCPKSFQINEKSAKSLFLNGLSSKTMNKSEKSLFLNGLGTKSYEKV